MNFSEYSSENAKRDFTLRRNSLHSMSMGLLGYGADWNLHHRNPLIPECSRKGTRSSYRFSLGIGAVWHLLIQHLLDALVEEQQVKYLNRCWRLNPSQIEHGSLSLTLKRLLTLMR